MRGNLKEFGIRSLFHFVESERVTGILYIQAKTIPGFDDNDLGITDREYLVTAKQENNYRLISKSEFRSWFVFLVNGKITYATETENQELNRLRDYLSYYQLENTISSQVDLPTNNTSTLEYNSLLFLLQKHFISPQQAKIIIRKIVSETVFELLSLSQGTFILKIDDILNFSLTEIEISPLMSNIHLALQTWKQFYPDIQSPYQYPLLNIQSKINQNLSSKTYNTLSKWIAKKASLLQLSRQLNCNLIDLAKALHPYIQQGFIKLKFHNSQNCLDSLITQPRKLPHVVCVDNDVAIGKKVEYILKRRGYQITLLTDSVQALTAILQIEPDIVICKVDLPHLSGYELCNMLKNSQACQPTKFIMLSEQEHFLLHLKTKVISSDDYLSLPFTPNELLILLEKHLETSKIKNLPLGEKWSTEKSMNPYQ
jgi:twitching motility two-component system response regulator PilG